MSEAIWSSFRLQTGVVSGEGILGLRFELYVGGNASAVLTLWPVLDGSTCEFVARFLRKLKDGQPLGVALAETKWGLSLKRRPSELCPQSQSFGTVISRRSSRVCVSHFPSKWC